MRINRRGLITGAMTAGIAPSLWPVVGSLAAGKPAPAAKVGQAAAAATRRKTLAQVRTWGYQLRLLNFPEMAASATDLLVTDHGFSDGRRFIRQFEPREIEYLQTRPDGSRRLVLAYLSIAEAERYRFYWDNAWFEPATKPSWLGEMNPRWAGNYPVDYWRPEWQRLITGSPDAYVARILAQGFDGIYLDRADVFQELLARHPQGAKTMAQFVARIAADARAIKPDCLVILQNAEELIAERPVREAIDAIAKEDLYFGLDFNEGPNSAEAIGYAERDLQRAQAAGKRIFVVEYVGAASAQRSVIARCKARGFLPYFAPRDLRSLTADPATLAPDYRGPLAPQEGSRP
jgi:cysteinyl-tRNA synthetase, unknown class